MAYVNLLDGRKVSYVTKRARQTTQDAVQKVQEVSQQVVTKEKYEAPTTVLEDKTMRNAKIVGLAILTLIVIILIYQRK